MERNYTALDNAIIESLMRSAKQFTPLFSQQVRAEAEALATVANLGKPTQLHTPDFRILDRRLQALRKAGKILYNTKTGWNIAQ